MVHILGVHRVRYTLGGIYLGVYARYTTVGIHPAVYARVYTPGYTTPYTVRHGQRTCRHTSARVRALGSRMEKPMGGSLSSVLKLINVLGLMGPYAQSYSVSQGIT